MSDMHAVRQAIGITEGMTEADVQARVLYLVNLGLATESTINADAELRAHLESRG
jgi:hypothetical protein